ncbi:MAG: DUF6062 family protein [Tepidisphaeraceae bacterium]
MKQPQAKFIGFFKLIEAMKQPGCPICARIIEDIHHGMDSFLYESVNDSGLRDQIRSDSGLCHRHSWQLARFGDALGSAILFRDVLATVLASLGSTPSLSFFRKRSTRLGAQVCLFCRQEERSHEGLLSDLVAHIDDAELKKAWGGPAVLCIPHLSDLCGLLRDDAARRRITEMHRSKYMALCDEMEQLKEKQSYNHRPEEIGPEKDSWIRAIEVLVGRSGIS